MATDGTWFDAWRAAAYGPAGFWGTSWPEDHFRTAAATGPEVATAVLALAEQHRVGTVVDVGAGQGRLLAELHRQARSSAGAPQLTGLDLRPRPAGLPAAIGWQQDQWDVGRACWVGGGVAPLLAESPGPALLVGTEWLDDLPCRVAVRVPGGWAELDAAGQPGRGLDPESRDWVERWWPAGPRVEVGLSRDRAWGALVAALGPLPAGGLALMVDYGHERAHRPHLGSLAGYRRGRAAPAVPDPSVNLTASVAVDAVQAAGEAAGARTLWRRRQREALPGLLPAEPARHPDPVAALAGRSRRSALLSDRGWGGQWWLLQQVEPAGEQRL
jgi:hypothetical protein